MAIARPYPWIKQSGTYSATATVELGTAVDEYEAIQDRYSDGESFPVWVYTADKTGWYCGIGTLATGTPHTVTLGSPHWTKQGFNLGLDDYPGPDLSGTVTVTVGPTPLPQLYGFYGSAAAFSVPTGATPTLVTWDATENTTSDMEPPSITGLVRKTVMVGLAGDPGDATEYTVSFGCGDFSFSETLSIEWSFAKTSGLVRLVTPALPNVEIVHNGSSSVPFNIVASTELILAT